MVRSVARSLARSLESTSLQINFMRVDSYTLLNLFMTSNCNTVSMGKQLALVNNNYANIIIIVINTKTPHFNTCNKKV